MSDVTEDSTPAPQPAKPRKRSPGLAGIAVLVAVVALVVAAWSVWREQHATRDAQAAARQTAATLAALESQLAAGNQQAQAGAHHLRTLESGLDDLRSTVQGLDHRTSNLETAYTNLSGQQQSGRDTLLLNDAEMLLRTGQQRYELFHDSAGALRAYSQAIEVLTQVQNPAFAPVRASATTERDALAAAAPPSRQNALDTLSALRSKVPALPLPLPETTAPTSAKPGFWSRIAGSFSSIVKVSREDGPARPLADPRFARQTLALDLAQAQEALLAFDHPDYHTALEHAATTLTAQFDANDAGVKDFATQLQGLLAQRASSAAPQLGGALAQLQSLRASQPPAPASTTSSGATKP